VHDRQSPATPAVLSLRKIWIKTRYDDNGSSVFSERSVYTDSHGDHCVRFTPPRPPQPAGATQAGSSTTAPAPPTEYFRLRGVSSAKELIAVINRNRGDVLITLNRSTDGNQLVVQGNVPPGLPVVFALGFKP